MTILKLPVPTHAEKSTLRARGREKNVGTEFTRCQAWSKDAEDGNWVRGGHAYILQILIIRALVFKAGLLRVSPGNFWKIVMKGEVHLPGCKDG